MKILLIAYNYPPIRGPESIQTRHLVRELVTKGIEIDVITRCKGIGKKYSNDLTIEGNVIRTFSLENYLTKGIMRVSGLENLPDAERLWIPFALQKAKKMICKRKYDYIYTRSVPFSSHLIGLKLKDKFSIPWIASFSDPWTDSPYLRYKSKNQLEKNLKWERIVIENADFLTFTSKETIELVMKKYNNSEKKKAIVLPHMYDYKENTIIPDYSWCDKKKMNLIYAGNFYGKRNPEPLFNSVRVLNASGNNLTGLNILIVGKMPNAYIEQLKDERLSSVISYGGEVPYEKCQQYLAAADGFINIDAQAEKSVFFPSKIVEYLFFNKPIISISPKDGTVTRLLNEYGHVSVENGDLKGICNVLKLINNRGTRWIEFNAEAKEYYTPENVVEKFVDMIKKK